MEFDVFFQRVSQAANISSQKELAALLGVEQATISIARRRGVPKHWLEAISSRYGVSLDWLKTGTGKIYLIDNTILIPKISARACAGGGSFDVRDHIIEEVPFDKRILEKKGRPSQMLLMDVVGDSMSPEFEPGDEILVDQSQTELRSNKVYVIGFEDSLMLKGVQPLPEIVVLYSINTRYSPITLRGDTLEMMRVIGRVVHKSRWYD